MAATVNVTRAKVQSIPGVNRIDVEYIENAPGAGTAATSAAIPLGGTFSKIRCVGIAGKGATGLVQGNYIPDTSSTVKIRYVNAVAESTTIVATFECEA